MRHGQRGHILLLVMLGMTAAMLAFAAFHARMDARGSDDVRLQALWLARSAAQAGVVGVRHVDTPSGSARVEATRQRVVVDLEGARAVVEPGNPVESYTPSP